MAVAALLAAQATQAAPSEPVPGCDAAGSPAVVLAPAGGLARAGIDERAFAAHLRIELGTQGIALCAPHAVVDAVAELWADATDEGDALVILVVDRVTAKRVERRLDLASLPRSARPLVGALAAVQLLQASWAELSEGARARPAWFPPADRTASAPPAPRRWSVAAALSAAAFGGGLRGAGPQIEAGVLLGSGDWELRGLLAQHWGARVHAPGGTMSWRGSWTGGSLLRRLASSAGGTSLVAGPAVSAVALRGAGHPAPGATGAVGWSLGFVAGGTMALMVSVGGRVLAVASVSAGWTIRPVVLRDARDEVAAASGWSGGAAVGLRWELP